jgi:hypothetical protein
MKEFKKRWDITANWQLIYPVLGILALCLSSLLITHKSIGGLIEERSIVVWVASYLFVSTLLFLLFLKITLWLFKKLESRWVTKYRWELISIFLVFAITGSASARVSGPLLEFIGFQRAVFSDNWYWGVLYWTIRILIIFPIYQILLIIIGYLFGQYKFFRDFEEKMLSRMGLSFLFPSK